MLELRNISLRVGTEQYIDQVSLKLEPGEINILLGPTLSGKTSLMRLMAGLDKPSSGELFFNNESVLGKSVKHRNVAMVYQQFINYPTLSIFENIASPLRVARLPAAEIEARVGYAAELLRLSELLKRFPHELSGGQQQRVAIARALVKRAELVLLDEPLANLDYKLREELRAELPTLFAETGALLVYATTEPLEALALGGKTACLDKGRVVQFGPTLDLYNYPDILQTAVSFSDPPLNTAEVRLKDDRISFAGAGNNLQIINAFQGGFANGEYTIGIRPHHLRLNRESDTDLQFTGTTTVTELTGSESFIHFDCSGLAWVALAHGIHDMRQGQTINCYVAQGNVLLFDSNQRRVSGVTSGEL